MAKYQHFDPRHMAELAHHYLTSMVDEKNGYIYYSFTTRLVKTDLAGNPIGTAEGLVGTWAASP